MINFQTPYPQEYNDEPYPKDYIPPIFEKYTGKGGNPKDHIKRFVEHLGAHCNNKKLRLREFSKSLTDKAYTWYSHLAPNSVSTWEEMHVLFV